MNALEKVRFLKERKDQEGYGGPYLLDIRYRSAHWQPGEIEGLEKQYPWLPKFYINFIQEFDSLGLGFLRMYGSKKCGINPIHEEIEYWGEYLNEEIPIGKYADGSIYTINKKGEVIYYIKDDYECKKPKVIASSFERFIDECVLGKRYSEFAFTEDNSFYDFLKHQGWA